MVSVPRKTMDALVAKARSELPKTIDATTPEKPFVSESDIVMALVQHIHALGQPVGSKRTMMLLMAVDSRDRAPSAFRPDTAYVQNAPCGVFLECRADEAQHMPLAELALACRRAVTAQTSEDNMTAMASLGYEQMVVSRNQAIFGNITMDFSLLHRDDFSQAIVRAGNGVGPGKPVYYHSQSIEPKGPLSLSICVIMGRDRNGDFWMGCDLRAETWSRFMIFLNQFDVSDSS
ncbi:hypothetical protein jhhlp_005380 [Lomentospora prolificans]|uniref:Uncharacterized protein n=1 Tax=Lomentospora prolificans TaxID=41688 RepID=A0A2N3N6P7_9PEZI|nr:hypothetical protein jhhlp_005380 [Lomentospora prolificans]